MFDRELSFKDHVAAVCQSSMYQLRRIATVKRYLSESSLKTLVTSLVISRLDYCNSLLFGVDKQLLEKLQRVQNSAARMVRGLQRYDYANNRVIPISPVLKDLHWLKIRQRIDYKIMSVLHKTTRLGKPTYLSREVPTSTRRGKLLMPPTKSSENKTYFRRFPTAAATVWNQLPDAVTHALNALHNPDGFKRIMKTHFFEISHPA